MDLACPKEHVTEISSDSDHSTKVAPTTLKPQKQASFKVAFPLTYVVLWKTLDLREQNGSSDKVKIYFYLKIQFLVKLKLTVTIILL